MALAIDQLIKPLTEEDVKSTIYDLLAAVGINATAWQSGGTAKTIVAVTSKVVSGFTQVMSKAVKGTFLDYAEGVFLTYLALRVYGVERIPATFATGKIVLSNSGGGLYSFAVGELFVQNPATGKTYKNVSAFTLNPLQVGLSVDIIALEQGSDSTSGPNTITAFVTPLLGVTVNNPGAVVGTDEEKDADLRQRCLDALGSLSPFGGIGAYKYFAKSTKRPDGTVVGVNRVQVVTDNAAGSVQVWVATPSGQLAVDDLALVDGNIKLNAVPACVTVTVDNVVEVELFAQYIVWVDTNDSASDLEITIAVNDAITSFVSTYPIGGLTKNGTDFYFFVEKLQAVIIGAYKGIFDVQLNIPNNNFLMSQGEVVKITSFIPSVVRAEQP